MTSWKGDTEGDLALLERLRKGDRAAFEAIYRRYHAKLYTLALRYLKNRADTEDALQQLFVKLWTAREALFITRNLSGYLYGMLKHQVLNQIRNIRQRESELFLKPTFTASTQSLSSCWGGKSTAPAMGRTY